jgi:hypothetical protein
LKSEGSYVAPEIIAVEFFADRFAQFLSQHTLFSSELLANHLKKLVTLLNIDEEPFLIAILIFSRYAKRNHAVFDFKKEIELIYFFSVCSVIALNCCNDKPFNCVVIYKYFGVHFSIFLKDELHILDLLDFNVFFTTEDTVTLKSILSPDMLSLLAFSTDFPEIVEDDEEWECDERYYLYPDKSRENYKKKQ